MLKNKHADFQSLSEIADALRADGKKIVLCHGVFDIIHTGHLNYLRQAKEYGDFLIVSVTADDFVNKGPSRPVFSLQERLSLLASLDMVDLVVESHFASAVEILGQTKPDFYVKGKEYENPVADKSGRMSLEMETVRRLGGKTVFTRGLVDSSTRIARTLNQEVPEIRTWLTEFSSKFKLSDVDSAMSSLSGLKVLVIGELIVDEYISVEALGKSGKEPLIAFRDVKSEEQLGGSVAVAKHLSGLGCQVTLAAAVGAGDGMLEKTNLEVGDKISLQVLEFTSVPTIRKTRYIEQMTKARIFEHYVLDERISDSDMNRFVAALPALVKAADLVIVCDYGHGLLQDSVLKLLAESECKLAVNTQSNAGNGGFNSISRYPRVDLVCLNGTEVAREIRRRGIDSRTMAHDLMKQTEAKLAAVTQGAQGLTVSSVSLDSPFTSPAFASKIVDRVGAGDALFATLASLWAAGIEEQLAAFLANLAGALSVSGLGNSVILTSDALLKSAHSFIE